MHTITSESPSILQVASGQGGVVRRDQAFRAGYTRHVIAQRIKTGEWRLVGNSGYRLFDMAGPTNLAIAAASVLPNAAVSHFSAAAMLKILKTPTGIASVTVDSKTTHVFPGVHVFRNRDLAESHVAPIEGVPVTTIERTVVDLAAKVRPKRLALIVDELLAERRCTVERISDVLETVACKGKPGVTMLRSVLDERLGRSVPPTVLERAGLSLLKEAGFTGFTLEYPVPWDAEKRFDIAFPAHQLAIEWDSFRWHIQLDAFRRDRERDRRALEHGWRVLRFTWADVHGDPGGVIDSVRSVLKT